jgi:folate-binding protein YgfZ
MSASSTASTEPTLLHARADLGAFAVTGGDRLSWLNGLVTQDVAKLAPGAGAYGLATGKTGRILAEVWILAATDRVILVAARDRMDALREHLEKHLIMEDAEIGEPLARAVVFAFGPGATRVLEPARQAGADAASIDWTGRGDASVIVAAESDPKAAAEALAAKVPGTTLVIPDGAWEAQRIAWGLPRAGVDYGEAMPQEASLEKLAVSFSKGCYLGQEAVFMLEKRGHARKRLARVAVEGDAEVAAGVGIVLPDGGEAGTITSAARAPGGGWVAIASMKSKHIDDGSALTAVGRAAHVLGLAADGAPRREPSRD